MAENRQHHGEPDQERQRAEHQGACHDGRPERHGKRAGLDGSERGLDRSGDADLPVDQQGARDDADRERRQGEYEPDGAADKKQGPALRCGQDLAEQLGGASPLGIASAMNVGGHLVDVSPLSTIGALCIAGAPVDESRPLFNKLLAWGLSMSVVGALLCWLLF